MNYPEPGLELDKLVAEKVLGWYQDCSFAGDVRDWWFPGEDRNRHSGDALHLNRFSTDIRAAWGLAEKLRLCVVPFEGEWTAFKEGKFHDDAKQNAAPTAPHAICLAALNIAERTPEATACVITYKDNVLRCARYRTREENADAAKCALTILLGKHLEDVDFEAGGGTIEFYRSVG